MCPKITGTPLQVLKLLTKVYQCPPDSAFHPRVCSLSISQKGTWCFCSVPLSPDIYSWCSHKIPRLRQKARHARILGAQLPQPAPEHSVYGTPTCMKQTLCVGYAGGMGGEHFPKLLSFECAARCSVRSSNVRSLLSSAEQKSCSGFSPTPNMGCMLVYQACAHVWRPPLDLFDTRNAG